MKNLWWILLVSLVLTGASSADLLRPRGTPPPPPPPPTFSVSNLRPFGNYTFSYRTTEKGSFMIPLREGALFNLSQEIELYVQNGKSSPVAFAKLPPGEKGKIVRLKITRVEGQRERVKVQYESDTVSFFPVKATPEPLLPPLKGAALPYFGFGFGSLALLLFRRRQWAASLRQS